MRNFTLGYYTELYGEPVSTPTDYQAVFVCPNDDCKRPKLYVYLDTHSSYCFRCGEYKRYQLEKPGITLQEYKQAVKIRVPTKAELVAVEEPENFVSLEEAFIDYSEYLSGRGFSRFDITRARLRFGAVGTNRYNQILLPIYMDNVLVYYTVRNLVGEKRYLNPSNMEVPNKKSSVIFNYDYAKLNKTVVVCEGIFDAMTIGSSAIAILGKKMSSVQLDLIKKTWHTVILGLDRDACMENIEAYKKLHACGIDVKIMDLSESKDINEMGKERALDLLLDMERKNFGFTDLLRYRIGAYFRGKS